MKFARMAYFAHSGSGGSSIFAIGINSSATVAFRTHAFHSSLFCFPISHPPRCVVHNSLYFCRAFQRSIEKSSVTISRFHYSSTK
eukprot:UN27969